MLYTIAAVKGIEALAMMTVSDIIGDPGEESERISDDELRRGVDADDAPRLPRRRQLTAPPPVCVTAIGEDRRNR